MTALIHPQLSRLARRVHHGEVVFFVGAGFSIDSEKLSATRVIKRLVLRLHALEAAFDPAERRHTRHFSAVFGEDADSAKSLPADPLITSYPWPTLGRLASRYFEINEWMIRAFADLLTRAAGPRLSAALAAAERRLAVEAKWTDEVFEPVRDHWWGRARAVPEDDLPCRANWGKLLFLQTLGFLDEAVMSGRPGPRQPKAPPTECWRDGAEVERSFLGRLRPRHHVLARLAREGFCPTLLTTNFDLLLEGAFRLAGFCWPEQQPTLAATAWPHFDVVAAPTDFFERGKGFRTATILKVHGCARRLRDLEHDDHEEERLRARAQGLDGSVRDENSAVPDASALAAAGRRDPEKLFRYLPQLVYTFREIQNWRDDSWAADFVRTIVRTRTLVFSGYSASDPVLHDTVRGVYEEMDRKRRETLARIPARTLSPPSPPAGDVRSADAAETAGHAAPAVPASVSAVSVSSAAPAKLLPAQRAPAYFLAYDSGKGRHEFHGGEVLRSATRAVGGRNGASNLEHANYLRFSSGAVAAERLSVDGLFSWVHHLVFRRQQARALKTELPFLTTALSLGRRDLDFGKLRRRFVSHLLAEQRSVRRAPDAAAGRRRVQDALDWTGGFHRALRREWACAEAAGRLSRPSRVVRDMHHPLWYYPASERPLWTAWSVVVELALHTLARHAQLSWRDGSAAPGAPTLSAKNSPAVPPAIIATQAVHPTVLIRRRAEVHAPMLALTLEARGFERSGKRADIPGQPARFAVWSFGANAVPWTPARTGSSADKPLRGQFEIRLNQPPADLLWRLALGATTAEEIPLDDLLGSWIRQK